MPRQTWAVLVTDGDGREVWRAVFSGGPPTENYDRAERLLSDLLRLEWRGFWAGPSLCCLEVVR